MRPQDVIILCSLIANKECRNWKQSELASMLCMSSSTINASIKRLENVGLINTYGINGEKYHPVRETCMEYFVEGFSHIFLPGQAFHPKLKEIMNKNTKDFCDFFSILLEANLEKPLSDKTRDSIIVKLGRMLAQ